MTATELTEEEHVGEVAREGFVQIVRSRPGEGSMRGEGGRQCSTLGQKRVSGGSSKMLPWEKTRI